MKLIINDHETETGNVEYSYEIDVPSMIADEDCKNRDYELKEFRRDMIETYCHYIEGDILAVYDFEIEAENYDKLERR